MHSYRAIDCASGYGNEHEIGDALESVFTARERNVAREEVFITSRCALGVACASREGGLRDAGKLWNSCHEAERVRQACEQSLTDLVGSQAAWSAQADVPCLPGSAPATSTFFWFTFR